LNGLAQARHQAEQPLAGASDVRYPMPGNPRKGESMHDRSPAFAKTLAFAAACLLGILGCAPMVNVNTSVAPNADFGARKTYAWQQNPQMGGSMDQSIAGQQIHAAVDQALVSKGFQPVASGQRVDMLVDYRVMMRNQTELQGGVGWGGISTYNYTTGTLVVILIDPETSNFLWRGTAQSNVDPAGGGSDQAQNIQTAVQKMFATFPN
jgi:hypothetical protein